LPGSRRRAQIETAKKRLPRRRARPVPVEAGPRLDEQLCFPLYAAARLVVQAYAPLLGQLGLTYPQYLVLMVLWEQDGASVNEIGARLLLDSGTLTPILRRLDEARLVRRVARREDNRAVENWLTPAGRAMEQRAASIPKELFCRLAMPFPEFKRLRGSIRELLARLAQMVAEAEKAR
jgi:DNA-binding MarR family transcriptional regulator